MAIHKLHLEEFDEIDYQLIAIHSSLEDYRLAYYINQNLPINLKKENCNIQISNKEGETQFTRFVFEDSKDIVWNLVQNKNDVFVPSQNSNQGLFAETNNKFSTKIYLIPEFKNVDYFLKIENGEVNIDVSKITNCIKKIDRVSTVYAVEVEKIKSKTKTVPIILGLQFTFPLLHLLNLMSASVLLIFSDTWILFVVAIVVAWKALIIEKVRRNNHSFLWTQTLNILTCSLILILVLIFKQ